MTEFLIKFALIAFVASSLTEVAKKAFPTLLKKEVPRWARILAPVVLGVAAFGVTPVTSLEWVGLPVRLMAGFLAGTTASWSYEVFEGVFRRKAGDL